MPVYQNKKTKKWKFRVYTEDVYGNRKQFEKSGFNSKKEAQEAERDFVKLDKNDKCNITFSELWNDYDNYIKIKVKTQSYRSIKNRVEKHILPYFKDYKINKITGATYIKWQNEIDNKNYTYKYKSNLHGTIRTMLNYAIKFQLLKQNIASITGNFTRKQELKRNVDFWSYEEFLQFINTVDDILYKIFFETLYYTGLRLGEALALTWNDFDNTSLHINKTLTRDIENGKKIVNTPKTAKSMRYVKLDKQLIMQLSQLKLSYAEHINFDDSWYIFGGLKPLAPTTVARKKDYYCNQSKVKKIRIHDFRHSHASLLLSQNVPIIVISERLGHSDIEMTLNTYSHMIPKDEDKAIDILDKLKTNQI